MQGDSARVMQCGLKCSALPTVQITTSPEAKMGSLLSIIENLIPSLGSVANLDGLFAVFTASLDRVVIGPVFPPA